jgi:hypothetical protein
MNSIRMQVHVGNDGILRVEAPVDIRDAECEVIVVWNRKPTHDQAEWEAFIDATYGSLADDPIERGEQPPLEVRDEIE